MSHTLGLCDAGRFATRNSKPSGSGGALDGGYGAALRGGAAVACVGVGGDHVRGKFCWQMQAHDGFIDGHAPVVAHRVPVKLIVIGEELRDAIGFVADDEAMIAGRERHERLADAQLLVGGVTALLVGDGRAILGDFQNFDANAGVLGVGADEALVPARFGIDGQIADHSVAKGVADAVYDELFAHFERGVGAQGDVGGEREDAVKIHAAGLSPGLVERGGWAAARFMARERRMIGAMRGYMKANINARPMTNWRSPLRARGISTVYGGFYGRRGAVDGRRRLFRAIDNPRILPATCIL